MNKSLKLISAALAATISMSTAPVVLANPLKSGQSVQNSQENSVIKISSLEDLNHLRDLANSGENFEGKTIILENDIYITKDQTKNGDPVEFKPMFEYMNNGDENFDENVGFKGTFDGNGKTLHFNATNSNIFGRIGQGGIVKNLNITGKFEGGVDGAIVAMYSYGTIDNVKMDIVADNNVAGIYGFCWRNCQSGIIRNCEVRGKLSSADNFKGGGGMFCTAGICGDNDGIIESCKVFATLLSYVAEDCYGIVESAGIASFNRGIVRDCIVKSDIINEIKSDVDSEAGGLVSTNNGLVANSIFEGTITSDCAGGIAGKNYNVLKSCKVNAKIKGKYSAEFASGNIWGDASFSSSIYKETSEGKGPQAVIDGCEFCGSIDSADHSKIAVFENESVKEFLNGQFVFLDPKITNCKINGKIVERKIDSVVEYHPAVLIDSAVCPTVSFDKG